MEIRHLDIYSGGVASQRTVFAHRTLRKPTMLLNKNLFTGLEHGVHLSAGGETPMLNSHRDAFEQFMQDKAQGERARQLIAETMQATREQCATLLNVAASDITFVSSASEGINIVTYGLDWQPGDNVVIADVEFGSGVFPWTVLKEQGVEVKIVRHKNWQISLSDIEAQIDDRTKVVLMSHVSMFTGQRLPLKELAEMVHRKGAALVLDATHAVGVVPVDAYHADVVVSSCYKWLLATHGTAIFYWNRETLPELKPPFLGWNSAAESGGWKDPLNITLHADANQFLPGNPSYLSIYLLNNALKHLLPLGRDAVEQHALDLTGRLYEGISQLDLNTLGLSLMTARAAEERAGNICIMSERVDEISAELRQRGILVWGTYRGDSRLRISAHVYNDQSDIDACLGAIQALQ